MKKCSSCGAEVKDHVKVCTHCGTRFPEVISSDERRIPNEEKPNLERTHKQPGEKQKPIKQNKMKSKLPLIIGLILLLSLLFGLYKFFEHKFSPVNQAEEIKQSLMDKDYAKLSSILSVGDFNLSESEAEAFARYIAATGNVESFGDKVVSKTKEMLDNKQPDGMVPAGGKDAIQITIDKKKFGIFKSFAYEVPKLPVYITGKDDKQIVVKINDKDISFSPKLDSKEKFGDFPLGNHELDATKTTMNGETQGKLMINMSESDEVEEKFEVAYIKINVDIPSEVSEDSVMAFINNENVDYDSNGDNIFGPYLIGKKLKIYAEGDVGNKTLVTNKEIETPTIAGGDPTDIDLSFESSELADEPKTETKTIIVQDDDEEDTSDVITVTRENVQSLAEDFSGVSFDYDRYEYRTPVYEDGKYGFGIFDENDDIVGSFDVYKDGTIIEYDENGDVIRRGNIND